MEDDLLLEEIIYSAVEDRQRKVALVIARAVLAGFTEAQAAEKIYSMCSLNLLESYGDLSKWRESEISIKQQR